MQERAHFGAEGRRIRRRKERMSGGRITTELTSFQLYEDESVNHRQVCQPQASQSVLNLEVSLDKILSAPKYRTPQPTTQEVEERSQGWIQLRARQVGNLWGARRTIVE